METARIAARSAEDPGTAGDEVEEQWATFLRDWLPTDYTVVTKGRVLSELGEASPQVDVLVLSPAYPRALIRKKLYLAAGVVAAFECKLTLRARDLKKTAAVAATMAKFSTPQSGTPFRDVHRSFYLGLLANDHELGTKQVSPLDHIHDLLHRYSESASHPRELVDVVCVGNVGIVAKTIDVHVRGVERDPLCVSALAELAVDIAVSSGFTMYSPSEHHEWPEGVPLSLFIARLLERLAQDDTRLRSFVEYYNTAAAVFGVGLGRFGYWDGEVLSKESIAALRASPSLAEEEGWSEWSLRS